MSGVLKLGGDDYVRVDKVLLIKSLEDSPR
jgi:hypothetical protein